MSNNNVFNQFRENHPFLLNGTLIVLALVIMGYIALLFIDVFTLHGQERLVPNVRNLPLEQAIDTLEHYGFNWEISDSTTFDEHIKPGVVIDQDPHPMSYIKPIRTIYLTRFPSGRDWRNCAHLDSRTSRSTAWPRLTKG